MHKDTCLAIKDVLKRREDDVFPKYRRITIIPAKDGNWFWSMEIVMQPRFKHLCNHIDKLGCMIGRFYGESLGHGIKGRTVRFA